jgi:methylmalonyl-CoA mutase N-terminal domain/subunit
VNTEIARSQVERLRRVRAERDAGAVERTLAHLGKTARGDENLMPAILDAVRAYATLGEICGELRKTWGEYRPPTVV